MTKRRTRSSPSTASLPGEYRSPDNKTVSIREIENGFMINEYGSKGGKHYDRTYYSPEAPKVTAPTLKSNGRGGAGRNQRLSKIKL